MEETKCTEVDLALECCRCVASVELVKLRNMLSDLQEENKQYKTMVRKYFQVFIISRTRLRS